MLTKSVITAASRRVSLPKGPCSYMGYTWALRYMGTPWGPKHIPYTYMDPLGLMGVVLEVLVGRDSMTILGTGIFSTGTI